jgi:hypothetical protein
MLRQQLARLFYFFILFYFCIFCLVVVMSDAAPAVRAAISLADPSGGNTGAVHRFS